MYNELSTWALVLAAGEGTRLRKLTTTSCGMTIPKQFWSLCNGPSLLREALARSGAVARARHTTAVVAGQHRRWWQAELKSLPAENVIVQPANRGTGVGILLPLLHIMERDPDAHVVILPSDHHVREEAIFAHALRRAVEQLHGRLDETVLLGLEPESLDPELGYIVPGSGDDRGTREVLRFVEKPPVGEARELIEHGALWNAFIVASTAHALLALFRRRIPRIVNAMRAAVQGDLRAGSKGRATVDLYGQLPTIDFSREILPGQETHLRVLTVAPCGWSDLGTPERVENALRLVAQHESEPPISGSLNLAAQHHRFNQMEALHGLESRH